MAYDLSGLEMWENLAHNTIAFIDRRTSIGDQIAILMTWSYVRHTVHWAVPSTNQNIFSMSIVNLQQEILMERDSICSSVSEVIGSHFRE